MPACALHARSVHLSPWSSPGRPCAPPYTVTSPAVAGPANPGDVRNCSDFASYNAAWVWYETYKPSFGDVAHLDSDGNGYPCENLPNPPVDAPPTLSLGAGATEFPTFGPGYWMLEANGSVFGFGSAVNLKGTTGTQTAGQGPFRPYAGAVVGAAQGRMLGPALSGQRTFYESLCIMDETGLRFGHGTFALRRSRPRSQMHGQPRQGRCSRLHAQRDGRLGLHPQGRRLPVGHRRQLRT